MKIFLLSLLQVIGISVLGGVSFWLVGFNFWYCFLLFFVLQYILFSFVGGIITHNISEKRKILEIEKLENLSTILECSYCNKPNLITFKPNSFERLEFECQECKNRNSVLIQFVVAQITDPINIPKTEAKILKFIEEEENIIDN